jgi:hypothetical protein
MTITAYILWGATLLIILLVIVPVAWSLLNKTLQHAISIEKYSSEMLESGIGIAGNTDNIKHLENTLEGAGNIVGLTETLKNITQK